MDILGPPISARYGPTQTPGIHAEADGFTAVCACKWVRWSTDRKTVETARTEHEKKCKTVGGGGDA